MADVAAPDKSTAACTYINESLIGLNKLKEAVCKKSGASEENNLEPPKPAESPKTLTETDIDEWLKNKAAITGNDFLKDATVTADSASAGSFIITNASEPTKTFTVTGKMVLDDEKDNIAAELSGTPGQKMVMSGGRRGKRSARRSKSHKGGRRSRKGGRKSRGCKGRRSRGRARTIKGGAKMSKELKAWMERQKKATGITAISKKTIDAAKTTSQATGSEQRSESGKHVAAKNRGF